MDGARVAVDPPGAGTETLHGALFALMQDAVLYGRFPDRRILDVNAAFLRLFGYGREELLQAGTEIIHVDADHHRRFGALLEDRLVRGEPVSTEWPFRRKDGSVFLAHVTLQGPERYQGRPIGLLGILRDVTTQRERERRLAVHARVLDSMAEGVCLTTVEGVVVHTNPAQDAMFGARRGEAEGAHVLATAAGGPEERKALLEEILLRLAERGRWEGELAHGRKDGAPFFTHARVTRLEGDEPLLVWVQEDVTERKRLEARERDHTRALKTLMRVQETLSQNLELERVVQAATDASTALSGAQFGAFFHNARSEGGESRVLYALSGAPREAFKDFPIPRDTPLFGPTFRGEGPIRCDDVTQDPRYGRHAPRGGLPPGHLPVRSYLAVPVVSRDGTVHGGLFLGHREPGRFSEEAERLVGAIAAQAAIAIDNANFYARAKESEERWRSLVENAPVHILTLDEEGRVLTANRGFDGEPGAGAAGGLLRDAFAPEERDRAGAALERVLASGEPVELEARVLPASGGERWFHARVAPLRRGGRKGAVVIATDVTRRKADEAELALIRAQLIQGEKLAALGSLVSGVAHELRTPLTFLANNAYLVRQRLERAAERGASAREARDETAKFVAELTAGVDRINQLVEDLRRYTKARRDPEPAPGPLHRMITDAIEIFRATNRSRNPLEASLAPTPPILGNKGALQQLVLNLLQNAADASPPGEAIRVVTRGDAKGVVLEVADRGCGVPPEVAARMYEPLFTTKPEGTGLGLSIVKRIVDEHRATIECESAPGAGTTFRVTFPPA